MGSGRKLHGIDRPRGPLGPLTPRVSSPERHVAFHVGVSVFLQTLVCCELPRSPLTSLMVQYGSEVGLLNMLESAAARPLAPTTSITLR